MKSLVPFPSEVVGAELVRSSKNAELWRASFSGKPVALRLFRLERSLIAPPAIMERAAEIDAQLELTATAKMIAAGESGEGWYVAEEWIEGTALDHRTDLRGVASDLLRLHRAGKWHGGVTPSRIVSNGAGVLLARSWATFLSTLPREQLTSFAEDVAPELLQHGPSAAGPANDVHGFAQVLAACGKSGPLIRRALSSEVADRPTLSELLGER
jgi:hypothetical protein